MSSGCWPLWDLHPGWRALLIWSQIEMGMRNHELVPTQLIENIAGLRHGGVHSAIATVAKHKLLHHERKLCESGLFRQLQNYEPLIAAQDDGYRLTYSGYDFLAVHALVQQSVLSHVGQKLGVGKESGWLAPKACLTQDNHVYRCVSCNKRERWRLSIKVAQTWAYFF